MNIEGLRQVRRKVKMIKPELEGIVSPDYVMVLVSQYKDNLGNWHDFPLLIEEEENEPS
jgi:hypothetical protein